jgi:hypothetical protein
MGSIINEKIEYIKLYIFRMAAEHCRIKNIVWTDIYCLAIIKGQYLARQPTSTKEGNKYCKQIKYCKYTFLQRQKKSKCWNTPQHKTQCLYE